MSPIGVRRLRCGGANGRAADSEAQRVRTYVSCGDEPAAHRRFAGQRGREVRDVAAQSPPQRIARRRYSLLRARHAGNRSFGYRTSSFQKWSIQSNRLGPLTLALTGPRSCGILSIISGVSRMGMSDQLVGAVESHACRAYAGPTINTPDNGFATVGLARR